MSEVEEAVSDIVGGDDDGSEKKDPRVERLNTIISIAVALVATFLAISNVKDGNICQAMQRAQAGSNDQWAYFQAKSTKSTSPRAWSPSSSCCASRCPPSSRRS